MKSTTLIGTAAVLLLAASSKNNKKKLDRSNIFYAEVTPALDDPDRTPSDGTGAQVLGTKKNWINNL